MKDKITQWLIDNKDLFIVKDNKKTLFHLVAILIHYTGRLTCLLNLFNFFQKKHQPKKATLREDLKRQLYTKLDLYQQLIKTQQDQDGFIETNHCDSLLFSSWVGCTGVKINIKAALDNNGFWHRRPTNNPCYPTHSQSSISRDMIVGLIWYMYFSKDKNLAEQFLQQTRKNFFIMGCGIISRLILMPPLEATLAEVIHKLGGKKRLITSSQFQPWSLNLEGYQIKLAVAHALLRGKIKGYITRSMLKMFEKYSNTHPESPLLTFATNLYTTGNMDQVVTLLLDESLWPSNRLPTNHDRKEYWLVQKSNPLDYLPATNRLLKIHSGGDFIFYAWLIKHAIENEWK